MTRSGESEIMNRCANCGATIRTDEWHRVTTDEHSDRLYAFCSEECYEAWDGIDAADD